MKNYSVVIDDLSIEVTRRCNLECEHCLRGEPQDLDFNPDILEEMIKENNIITISNITFTGGEPSLALEVIDECISILERNYVDVYNFFIATNGRMSKERALRFCNTLIKLYLLCTDNEISKLKISNTIFHETQESLDGEVLKIFDCLKFSYVEDTIFRTYDDSGIIRQGRAEYFGSRIISPNKFELDYDMTDLGDSIIFIRGDVVYLNAKGDIIPGCDFSYDYQEMIKIGRFDSNLIDIIEEFNSNFN